MEKFFVRGNHDIRLWLDTFYFEADLIQKNMKTN